MSIRVMSTVWADAPYDGGALIVLLALADWSDDGGYCFPKVPAIAKKSRLTERQVRNILRDFRRDGTLSVERGGGRGVPNRYRINPERLSVKSDSVKPASVKSVTETLKSATQNPETCDSSKRELTLAGSAKSSKKDAGNRHYPSIDPSTTTAAKSSPPKEHRINSRKISGLANNVNLEKAVEGIARAYPKNSHLGGRGVPRAHQDAIRDAVLREVEAQHITEQSAAEYLLCATKRFAELTANWPSPELRFIPSVEKFFGSECLYTKPDEAWTRQDAGAGANGSGPQYINPLVEKNRALGLNDDGSFKPGDPRAEKAGE